MTTITFTHPPPPRPLTFTTHNARTLPTLLLLPGFLGDPSNFIQLTTLLPNQHIIIPHLHSEGPSPASSAPRRVEIEATTHLLAELLRLHARDGRANVVGCSMGSHLALALAARCPERVAGLLVTGFGGTGDAPSSSRGLKRQFMPYGLYASVALERALPRSWTTWALDGHALPVCADAPENTLARCREVGEVCGARVEYGAIQARTLVCAATRGTVLVPSADSLDGARGLWREICGDGGGGEVGRGKEQARESVLVELKGMRHPWFVNCQELFARVVDAWFMGEERDGRTAGEGVLPEEVTVLEGHWLRKYEDKENNGSRS